MIERERGETERERERERGEGDREIHLNRVREGQIERKRHAYKQIDRQRDRGEKRV